MGPEHGEQELGRGWGVDFNMKILLAKESSYEFLTLFSHVSSLPSIPTLTSSTSALGGCCCYSDFAFGFSSCDPCRVSDAVISCLFQFPI